MSTGEADLAPVVASSAPVVASSAPVVASSAPVVASSAPVVAHDDDLDMKIRGEVVDFLRDLAYKVEGARLSPEADREVSEFYLRWSFMNAMFSQEHPATEESPKETSTGDSFADDSELLKFMSLGWFVYKNLLDPQ